MNARAKLAAVGTAIVCVIGLVATASASTTSTTNTAARDAAAAQKAACEAAQRQPMTSAERTWARRCVAVMNAALAELAPPTTTPPPTSHPTTTAVPPTTTTPPPTTTVPSTTPIPPTTVTPPGRLPRADAGNTGPRTSSFTASSGHITASGTAANPLIISGRSYTSLVRITGSHVIVRDSLFAGGVWVVAPSDGVVIEWSEIRNGLSLSSSWNTTVRNTEIRHGGDFIHVTSDSGRYVTNALIDTVWAHTPTAGEPAHVDGVQIRGVKGLTIKGSDIDLGVFESSHNAAFFTQYAGSNEPFGHNTDVRVVDCWMDGGGLTFRYEDQHQGVFEVTGLRVGNHYNWGPQYNPRAGSSPTLERDNMVQLKDGRWVPLDLL